MNPLLDWLAEYIFEEVINEPEIKNPNTYENDHPEENCYHPYRCMDIVISV